MEEIVWSKLDDSLIRLYRSWQLLEKNGWNSGYPIPQPLAGGNTSLLLCMVYEGDLAPLEAIGFKLHLDDSPGVAYGHITFEQMAELTQHVGCLQLKFGRQLSSNLGTSAIAIHARDENENLAAGIWHFKNNPPTLSGNSGEGVVVGIIDSGIDYEHEYFTKLDGSGSRIMAIWDMALTPQPGESSPDVRLVRSGTTYGVEYTQAQIEAALNNTPGAQAIRHRDRPSGHGTHVAGIAAGNGRPGFEQIGIAPKAKIIVVNYTPSQGNVTLNGSNVANEILFRDAFHYIRRKARLVDTDAPDQTVPVAINCSFGSGFGPHDGRDADGPPSEESYLRDFRVDTNGDEINGSAVVFSSGNYSGKNRHLVINLGNSSLTLPFELKDERDPKDSSFMRIQGWYKHDAASPANVTVEIETPDGTKTDAVSLGNTDNKKFDAANDKEVDIFHRTKTDSTPAYGSISRNRFTIDFTPANQNFLTGAGYKLKITGAQNTEIHIWTETGFDVWPEFNLSGINANTAKFENQNTLGSPGHSPDVITVANYNDVNNHLNYSSSRGPLVNYSSNAFPVPQNANVLQFDFKKPSLAAPGTSIHSAGDGFIKKCKCCRKVNVAVNYTDKSGTSMSAPHVTGIVALMLGKNKNLTQSQIKKFLEDNVDTGNVKYLPDGTRGNWNVTDASPNATLDEIGAGKVDARKAINAVPTPTP